MNRKKIELCLSDGTFNGIVAAKFDRFLGRMTKIDKEQVDEHYEHKEEIEPELEKLRRPGIYFLMGQKVNGSAGVYIGQSGNVYERINEHIGDYKAGNNSFSWTTAYAFTRKNLDLTALLYLEYQFCQLIKDCERYECLTTKVTLPKVDVYDETNLKDDIRNIQLLLKAVGCNVLEDLSSIVFKDVMLSYKDENGADAKAWYHNGKFVVKEGSKISNEIYNSIRKDYLDLRKMLQHFNNKTIVDGVFTRDYEFDTISPATAVICGRAIGAKEAWKTAEGVSVKQAEKLHVKK